MLNTPIKAIISVKGKFHAFHLAQAFAKRDALHQLITTYPKYLTRRAGIPRHLVTSFLFQELAYRMFNKLPGAVFETAATQYLFSELFDRAAATVLKEGADMFIGWSGVSWHALHRAKAQGLMTVIERGSSHIQHQSELLTEEYARFGRRFGETHPKTIEKEIAEYSACDFINVPSSFVKRTFLEKGVAASKIIQIPYCVDVTEFSPVPKEDNVFRVIFCGNLSFQKGLPYLLEAFHQLSLPKAELWLVGKVYPELRPILKKYESPAIRVFGSKPQSELKWFYSQCDLFILPSIQDGFGMVQAQAMACGLPVVCTANTGAADMVTSGMNGFVVPIRSVSALQEKIVWTYENPRAGREMGESARKSVNQDFSVEKYGNVIYETYRRLLAERNPKVKAG